MMQNFLVPLYLQTVYGYNALQSGLILAALLLGAWMSKFTIRYILRSLTKRMLFNCIFVLLTFIQLAVGLLMVKFNLIALIIMLFLLGFVIGVFMTAINTEIYNSLNKNTTSQGTLINSASIQLGSSFSVVVAALILMISSNQTSLAPTTILPRYSYMTVLFTGATVTFILLGYLQIIRKKVFTL